MASTFDPLLRLELQGTGENANTWGDKTNNNLELIADAIAGHVSISIAGSGDYTLTTANAATDQARRMIITLTGALTGNRAIIVPSESKVYFFRNNTTGNFAVTVKTASGVAAVLPAGFTLAVVCDGTDCFDASEVNRVAKSGDTMTGDLTIAKSAPALVLNDTSSATAAGAVLQRGGVTRWQISADTAQATNPSLSFAAYNGSGVLTGSAFTIQNDTRVCNFEQIPVGPASDPSTANQLTRKAYVDALIPSGTSMLFAQTAAPTGWTKSTTHNNKALRVVSGTASSGGTVAFTTAFASQAVAGTVGSTTLTVNQIPNHTHTGGTNTTGDHQHSVTGVAGDGSFGPGGSAPYPAGGTFTGVAGAHSHTFTTDGTGGGQGHTHTFTGTAINLAVQYVDVIIATKD